MLGKQIEIEKLKAVTAELAAVAALLDRQRVLVEYAPLEVTSAARQAAEEVFHRVFFQVQRAYAAGERDRGALLRMAEAPIVRMALAVPEPEMATALHGVLTVFLQLVIDRFTPAEPRRLNGTEVRP